MLSGEFRENGEKGGHVSECPEQRKKKELVLRMGQGQRLNSEDSDQNPRPELGQKVR